jgi:hypothetical protein
LTHFTTEEISNFAVRRDGRLAILRGHPASSPSKKLFAE